MPSISPRTSAKKKVIPNDKEYDVFLAALQNSVLAKVLGNKLFMTDAQSLWKVYLRSFPIAQRQHYDCHACRQFIDKFGGLVVINEDGAQVPALWTLGWDGKKEAAPLFSRRLFNTVREAAVTGVFYSSESIWGEPLTHGWRHMAFVPPAEHIFEHQLATARQASAEKLEDFKNVARALAEFSTDTMDKAVTLLKTDALYRSEKVPGQAEWLLKLARECRKVARWENKLWSAVANAPAGFCHPRASMIGTLLEDLKTGVPIHEVQRRFKEKMHPMQYQRPTAPPSLGNIDQAEKIVEKLGIERSFLRRYAMLDECEKLWIAQQTGSHSAGVTASIFSVLKNTPEARLLNAFVGYERITWEKFHRTVLPTASEMKIKVPSGYAPFSALTTAVDLSAPPILQWDRPEKRNPFGWYFWNDGSPASQWGLIPGSDVSVLAVTLKPNMWGGEEFKHHGRGVLFVLEGCRDNQDAPLGLFPEILKSELHPVRSVIEAYNRTRSLEGIDQASACGLMFTDRNPWNVEVIVRTNGSAYATKYLIDRMD